MGGNAGLSQRAAIDGPWERVPDPAGEVANAHSGGLDVSAIARDEIIKLTDCLFLLAGSSQPPRSVIFSSVDPGEGSSQICAHVGAALACRSSKNVCLVDANLHSPSLHRQFALQNICGLEDMVLGERPLQNMARQLSPANLWMVTAGRRQVEPHALLSSSQLRERLVQLKNDFDYVLIEAPPVGINGTATLLGPLADGVVLVIDANSTRREVARSAKTSLERANVRLLGAVLNDRTFPIPDAIYRNI
jgi:capsular exopolysaccharide synthesis family protein